jgi:hypothetical protein
MVINDDDDVNVMVIDVRTGAIVIDNVRDGDVPGSMEVIIFVILTGAI